MSYLEELLPKFRKGAKIRQITWDDNKYIYCEGNQVFDEQDNFYEITFSDFLEGWEFYRIQETPDWQVIIDNKCLCWFWDDLSKLKHLKHLQAKEEYGFRDELGVCWGNCCPVRRDEVTFYEDRTE